MLLLSVATKNKSEKSPKLEVHNIMVFRHVIPYATDQERMFLEQHESAYKKAVQNAKVQAKKFEKQRKVFFGFICFFFFPTYHRN